MRWREAFQEIDYRAMFGTVAKWATEIDSADRVPEIMARAFAVAQSGRPGPVVVALPEDVLSGMTEARAGPRVRIPRPCPAASDIAEVRALDSAAAASLERKLAELLRVADHSAGGDSDPAGRS